MIYFCHCFGTMFIWHVSWWRHKMETFSALLAICTWNCPVTGEFAAQRPVTHSFDVFFELIMNKRLNKQSWGWWLETPSRPLWHHRNVIMRSNGICLLQHIEASFIFTHRDFTLTYHFAIHDITYLAQIEFTNSTFDMIVSQNIEI